MFQAFDSELTSTLAANMEAAKEAAILAGDVDAEDGMPFLEVDGDGGWGVRSYNHSMRSPVGWVNKSFS